MSENVKVEKRGAVAVVTMNKPPANALDIEFANETADVFGALAEDGSIRSAVLTGTGRVFSAGADLKKVPNYGADDQDRMVDALNRIFYSVYRLPVPVVGAINGHAIAGGLVLALCTDKRLAATGDYQVGVTEVRVGIPYPVSAIEVCRAELAPADFRRMVLFGQNIASDEAHGIGIFDEMVAPDRLMDRALACAEELAGLPRDGFMKIKNQMRQPAFERMRAAVEEKQDPLFGDWLSDETLAAATAVLRG